MDDELLRDRRQRSPNSRREFRDSPDMRRGDDRPFGGESGYEGRGFRPRSRSPPWRQDIRDRSESSFDCVFSLFNMQCCCFVPAHP